MSFRPPVWAQDLLLALFVTVMQVQGTIARNDGEGLGPVAYLLLVVSGTVVVVRRRWPVTVFVVAALASVAYYSLGFPDGPGWLGLFVALYTLTALGDGRRSVVTAAAGIGMLAVCWMVTATGIEPPEAVGWVFFRIGASVMSAALGESVRSRKVIAADAVEHARQEERLRIAREVHDTVAHAIAIINVQSGVTAHVLDKRPEQARAALQVIEQTSARALREMRTVLGVLDDGRRPLPGLEALDDLAAEAREAGLEVELAAAPSPPAVPGAVGSAVYRIVQESITNVIRHAGATRVTVALEYGADTVRIRVADDGGRPAGIGEPGRGILGMRERCHLLGGEFDAGPLPGGGFAVSARLPLATA